MAEQDLQQQAHLDFPASVGTRLRLAREAMRLSRADVAARTKIAERHLAAIEEERFADLASSTYAVGFSRAYARTVGLDEREIAQAVRVELDMVDEVEAPAKPTFEPGDPARIPSVRLAWVAGAGAVAVVALVVAFWGSYIFPAVSLPDLINDTPAPLVAKKAVLPPAPAGPTAQDPVAITATQDGVWVKITDAAGKQLFQKEMKQGESFTIPTDAAEPKLRTAWPDALSVTIGGRPVAPLADKRTVITVPVTAAALLARGMPAPTAPQPAVAAPAAVTPPAATAPVAARPAAQPAAPRPSAAPAARPIQASPAPAPRPSASARPTTPAPRPSVAPSARPSAAAPRPSQSATTPAPAAADEPPPASTVSQ